MAASAQGNKGRIDDMSACEDEKKRIASGVLAGLSGAAKDVMMQFFVTGPVWDGNLVAKSGRNELVEKGYAFRGNGWQALTPSGLELAVFADVSGWADRRWYRKQQCL